MANNPSDRLIKIKKRCPMSNEIRFDGNSLGKGELTKVGEMTKLCQ